MKQPRVFLADDHAMLLDAFTKLLEPTCNIVGRATDGQEVIDKAPGLTPDILILDIAMPGMSGIDVAETLKPVLPEVKCIYLTANEDPVVAATALRGGAAGYLLKKGAGAELIHAIHRAMKDETYISSSIAGEVIDELAKPAKPALTGRQREVLRHLAEGMSMKEIAVEMNITPRTVVHHRDVIKTRLQMSTNAELIRYASRSGIIDS